MTVCLACIFFQVDRHQANLKSRGEGTEAAAEREQAARRRILAKNFADSEHEVAAAVASVQDLTERLAVAAKSALSFRSSSCSGAVRAEAQKAEAAEAELRGELSRAEAREVAARGAATAAAARLGRAEAALALARDDATTAASRGAVALVGEIKW